jgi:hypothetical protein
MITFSFSIIWLDWVLLLTNFDISGPEKPEECKNISPTIFGAGSLFGYVPLLTAVATLKNHGARRGLLLATAISSVILSVYDYSEGNGVLQCNQSMAIIFFVQVNTSFF